VRHKTPASFYQRARSWLLRDEAQYNLVLGLEYEVLKPDHNFEAPLYFATIEDGGEVVGCGFRTPPFKLGLTKMPLEGVGLLADDVAEVYHSLPAVFGPEEETAAFANSWAKKQSIGIGDAMKMRIFALESLIPPEKPAKGFLRPAFGSDLKLVLEWAVDFGEETGLPGEMSRMVESMVAKNEIYIWEDGRPRSMVAVRGATPNGIRVCYVFTPREERGKGYASTSVAELSHRQFEAGRKFCFLYTDAENPTSNGIYETLGYRMVGEVLDLKFR
jgi:hypothetical protein